MYKGFEYIEKYNLLVNHITKHSIFDEVSYLLTITELIENIYQYNPKFILVIIKNKKVYNYDLKFKHWLELNLFPAIKEGNVEKIAFVVPFAQKTYRVPDFTAQSFFTFNIFSTVEDARQWFGIGKLTHLTGLESVSLEIPL